MSSINPDVIGHRHFEATAHDHVAEFYDDHIWPDTWVPWHDYAILGVRKEEESQLHESAYLQEEAPPEPAPPEAYLNVFQALEEVYRVIGPHQPVHRRLQELQGEFQALRDQGRLTEEEFARIADTLAQTALNHAQRSEEIMTWFMETHFRDFDDLTEGIINLVGPAPQP